MWTMLAICHEVWTLLQLVMVQVMFYLSCLQLDIYTSLTPMLWPLLLSRIKLAPRLECVRIYWVWETLHCIPDVVEIHTCMTHCYYWFWHTLSCMCQVKGSFLSFLLSFLFFSWRDGSASMVMIHETEQSWCLWAFVMWFHRVVMLSVIFCLCKVHWFCSGTRESTSAFGKGIAITAALLAVSVNLWWCRGCDVACICF